MLAFIDRHLINLDQVQFIEPLRNDGNQPRMRIHLGVDEALTVNYDFWAMHKFTGQVVQAQPGYSVIEGYPPEETEGDGWEFVETPVIAFRIDGKDDPVAITFEGEVDGDDHIVVAPNGRATNFIQRYKNAQEWKDQIMARPKPHKPAVEG